MPAVDAVILDLGNVLAFHDNDVLYHRLAARARSGIDADVVRRAINSPYLFNGANRGLFDAAALHREVCAALGIDAGFEEFAALWSSHFTVHDAVLPAVERLVGQVRLVLLSNTNVLHFQFLRPLLPVLDWFDALVLSYAAGLVKPEPAIYRLALAGAAAPPARTAFFDDLPAYVAAATALGLHGRRFTDAARFSADLAALGLATG